MNLDEILVPGLSWKKGKKSTIKKYKSNLRDFISETNFFNGGRIAVQKVSSDNYKYYFYPRLDTENTEQVPLDRLLKFCDYNMN